MAELDRGGGPPESDERRHAPPPSCAPPTLPFPVAGSTVEPGPVPVIPLGSPPPPAPPPPPPPPAPAAPPPAPVPAMPPAPAPSPVGDHDAATHRGSSFAPLRSDPPPRLLATWWLRYLLVLTMIVGIGAVVATEFAIGPGGVADAPVVIAPHVLAAMLLVAWSIGAMYDADRLVPATRYHRSSSCTLAALLWVGAFAAPLGFVAVFERTRSHFDEADGDVAAVLVTVAAALVGVTLVWLPFGYLSGQARRIGAPHRAFVTWFLGSMLAAIGAAAIVVMGLHDLLAESGLTDVERAVRTAVVYGVPAFVFALSTWRATTVFDEVIDLRWRRWRSEWETTLLELAAQPAPGPELADT